MIGIILAAGMGTRMGTYTRDLPKPMLSYDQKPFLGHVVDNLLATHEISKLYLTVGYHADAIKDYFQADQYKGKIVFIDVKVLIGTAHSVSLAVEEIMDKEDYVERTQVFITYGDVLTTTECYKLFLRFNGKCLGINHVDDPCEGSAVYFEQRGFVTDIIEKPIRGQSETNWNTSGLFKFSLTELQKELIQYQPDVYAMKTEWILTNTIRHLCQDHTVQTVEITPWIHLENEKKYEALIK